MKYLPSSSPPRFFRFSVVFLLLFFHFYCFFSLLLIKPAVWASPAPPTSANASTESSSDGLGHENETTTTTTTTTKSSPAEQATANFPRGNETPKTGGGEPSTNETKSANNGNQTRPSATTTSEQHWLHRPTSFVIVTLNWEHVDLPYTIAIWLLLASVAKILFHVHKKFGEAIPDSALLISVGLILGFALHSMNVSSSLYSLKSTPFFLYLLPPIIFDAGYFMPNRQLFENLDSVLLFAFVGTIWNTIAIGCTLWAMGGMGLFSIEFSAFEILIFASLISAVDPVAVIAVFEEIHVNEFLFINVFGEALLNDGVSVVLYQMFLKFTLIGEANLTAGDYLAGVASFLVIAFGGILIGLIFAVIVSLATRFSSRVKTIAPVFIFIIPYLSYLTAEMFGLSSILAIVACGIMMKQYVKENITHDASNSVKYFIKMLAQCSETVIFMFLGLSTVSSNHHFDTVFVVTTLVLCLIYRVIGVVVQCSVLNRFRNKKFSVTDQFVLSYGGLRGAIAFGLVMSLPSLIHAKQMFVTTCIAVIFFTVFLQGITIRPLLFWLKVEKHIETEDMLVEKIYNRYFDYTMAGIEDIIGQKGRNTIRDNFERFNAKVLKPLLIRNVTRKTFPTFDASQIIRAYRKITLQEACKLALAGSKFKTTIVDAEDFSGINQATIKSAYGGFEQDNKAAKSIRRSYSERFPEKTERPPIIERSVRFDVNEENVEAIYHMFSELLDRKMDELRTFESSSRPERIPSSTSDIKSDYFKEMKRGGGGDSTTLSSTSNNEGNGGDGTADQIEMAVRLPRQAISLDQSSTTMEEGPAGGGCFPRPNRRVSEHIYSASRPSPASTHKRPSLIREI